METRTLLSETNYNLRSWHFFLNCRPPAGTWSPAIALHCN